MDEKTFLKNYDSSKYEKPSVTADLVIFSTKGSLSEAWEYPEKANLKVLLIKRGRHPFQGRLALPGGFANSGESLEEAARRELKEETGVEVSGLEQIGTFSRPGRDPRGWMITTAFRSFVSEDMVKPKAGDDAREAGWFAVKLTLEKEERPEEKEEEILARTWSLELEKEGFQTRIKAKEIRRKGTYGKIRRLEMMETGDLAFDHGEILLEGLLKK